LDRSPGGTLPAGCGRRQRGGDAVRVRDKPDPKPVHGGGRGRRWAPGRMAHIGASRVPPSAASWKDVVDARTLPGSAYRRMVFPLLGRGRIPTADSPGGLVGLFCLEAAPNRRASNLGGPSHQQSFPGDRRTGILLPNVDQGARSSHVACQVHRSLQRPPGKENVLDSAPTALSGRRDSCQRLLGLEAVRDSSIRAGRPGLGPPRSLAMAGWTALRDLGGRRRSPPVAACGLRKKTIGIVRDRLQGLSLDYCARPQTA